MSVTSEGQRVAFMVQNDAYGNNALDVIGQALKKKGIEIVASGEVSLQADRFPGRLTNVKSSNPTPSSSSTPRRRACRRSSISIARPASRRSSLPA